MQPTPPIALKPRAMSSLPESWMKSAPQAARCADTRARLPVASLTATTLGSFASRAIVSTEMSVIVRDGTL